MGRGLGKVAKALAHSMLGPGIQIQLMLEELLRESKHNKRLFTRLEPWLPPKIYDLLDSTNLVPPSRVRVYNQQP